MWKRTHNDRTRGLLLTGLKAAGSAAVAIAVASAIHLQFSATAGIIVALARVLDEMTKSRPGTGALD